ncbi:MAG: hypothetical protein ACYCYF_08365 [Anaerolineae bacterium]
MGPNWQQRTQQQLQQRQRDAMGAAWQQQQAAQRRAQAAMANAAQAPVDDPFLRVEAQAAAIQRDLAARRISEDVARSRLEDLMLQDSAGTWWMVGTRSGSWYRYDGTAWVPSPRPGTGEPLQGNRVLASGRRATADQAPASQRASQTFGVPSFIAGVLVWGAVAFMVGSALAGFLPGSGASEALVLGLVIWAGLIVLSWRQHRRRMDRG